MLKSLVACICFTCGLSSGLQAFEKAAEKATPSSTASAPTSWTPELMMSVRSIPTVSVAPDGKRVAFVVRDAVMTPEKSE